MDSPVRKQLKRNDYLRHKMFRKINRRRKAERLLAINAPAKELRRKLRRRTFKCGKDAYEDGKDEIMFSEVQQPLYDQYGNLLDPNTGMIGTTALPNIEVIANPDDVARGRAARWYKDFGTESNDATSTPLTTNYHLKQRSEEGAAKAAAWAKDHPYLNMAGLAAAAAPFAVASAPVAVGGGELVGQALANPYVDAAMTSAFGAHGIQSLMNGTANWETALEIAPLARLAKPMFNAGVRLLDRAFTMPDLQIPPMTAKLNIPSQDAGLLESAAESEEFVPRLTSLARPRKNYNAPKIDVSTKDFYNIVREDGSIDKDAFERAVNVYSKLSADRPSYTLNDVVGKGGVIRDHIYNVVKTAQDSPTPVGFTKQELVGAALLHDIGKIYGYEGHEEQAWRMLYPGLDPTGREANSFINQAFTNVPESVRQAVRQHGSTRTFGSKNQLLKATQFADVARGDSYEMAALKYPHLLYEREGIAAPTFKKIPLRDEIRDYINPWLRDNGYGPQDATGKFTGIPLDASEEDAWKIVEDAVDQHLSMMRGSRLSSGSLHMSQETIDKLALMRDSLIAEEITKQTGRLRPITNEDRLLYELERINPTPTGYGRAGVFSNIQPEKGLSYNTQGEGASKAYKIDPDVYDVKYTSFSDDVTNNYAHSDNSRENIGGVVRLLKKRERTPDMSMREYILANDWDLYSGEKTNPIGSYNMLQSPFRLLTGKSLLYESAKRLKEPIRRKRIPRIKAIEDNQPREYRPTGWGELDELEQARPTLYQEYVQMVDDINDKMHSLGFSNFDIKLAKNGDVLYPDQVSLLSYKLENIDLKADIIKKDFYDSTDHFGSTKPSIKDDIDYLISRGLHIKSDLLTFSEFQQKYWMTDTDQLAEEVNRTPDALNRIEEFVNELHFDGAISDKEYAILAKLIHSNDGKSIERIKKYFDKNKIIDNLEKRIAKNAKEKYFEDVARKRKESTGIDLKDYLKKVNDPERLMSIMREFGALPRHELPGFNLTFVINTANPEYHKFSQMNRYLKPASRKDLRVNQQQAIVGKMGEKVVEATDVQTNAERVVKKTGKSGRDYGRLSKRKLSHKTLANFLALLTGGAYTELSKPSKEKPHYASGKDSGIHIKPENRGKFTRLKKRTGKSASWFKAHGTPAQKKMATFALNARKWKHK